AQIAHYARAAERWGVRTGTVTIDLPAVVSRKDRIVGQWRSGQERKVGERKNLHLYRGHAQFTDPHRLRVGEQVLESERIFIDTGGRPDIPRLEGLGGLDYLTNATIMELREVPEHLLVLGGGYVGLEFGQMFRRFGSRVTIVHRGDHILPLEDADVSEELERALGNEGISLFLNAHATRVDKWDGHVVLSFEVRDTSETGVTGESLPAPPLMEGEPRAETVHGSHLLVATGRRP